MTFWSRTLLFATISRNGNLCCLQYRVMLPWLDGNVAHVVRSTRDGERSFGRLWRFNKPRLVPITLGRTLSLLVPVRWPKDHRVTPLPLLIRKVYPMTVVHLGVEWSMRVVIVVIVALWGGGQRWPG